MAELTELNKAIRALNDLWVECTDNEKADQIAEKRDKLDSQATEIADKIIREGSSGLNAAIDQLNTLTAAAIEAKKDVDDDVEKIRKISKAIDEAIKAITKVASFIAGL